MSEKASTVSLYSRKRLVQPFPSDVAAALLFFLPGHPAELLGFLLILFHRDLANLSPSRVTGESW